MTGDEGTDALRRQIEALHEVQRAPAGRAEGWRDAFVRLARMSARTLAVGRVTVWLFDAERDGIAEVASSTTGAPPGATPTRLLRRDAPAYFEALDETRTVAVEDAQGDPRTAELATSYLVPEGIGAMLDAPILLAGECRGVVCHEHDRRRTWTVADEAFAASVADLAAMVLASEDRRVAEAKLQQREEQLAEALSATKMGVWEWRRHDESVTWSDEVGPVIGRARGFCPSADAFIEMLHPDDRAAFRDSLRRAVIGPSTDYLTRHRIQHPDGSYRWIEGRGRVRLDATGRAVGIVGTIADVEHVQRLEEELRHAQKMEGIGRLAGGIAHDFNNLLTAARFSLSELTKGLEDESRAARHAQDVDDALERAAQLTSQLLAFARKQPRRVRDVDLSVAVGDAGKLIRRVIGEDVALELTMPDGPGPWIRIDPGQLEQVLVNLAVNARDAMPRGGALRVTLAKIDDRERAAGSARLVVSDDGVGIPPDTLGRVLEPFFTTKPAGAGTGLGLSTCVDIVREADGGLTIDSAPGRGTTVTMSFPLTSASGRKAPPRPAPRVVDGAVDGRGRKVLLVEDELLIRRAVVRTLRRAGYDVVAASCGEDAVEISDGLPQGSIEAVVSDVVLPGLRGKPLLDRLRARHPNAAILFVSGYADDVARRELGSDEVEFLPKPFGPQELTRKLSGLLEAGPE